MLKRVLIIIPVVLTAYAISFSVAPVAVEPRHNQPSTPSTQHEHNQPPRASSEMMKTHEQMMAEMKAAYALRTASGGEADRPVPDAIGRLRRFL